MNRHKILPILTLLIASISIHSVYGISDNLVKIHLVALGFNNYEKVNIDQRTYKNLKYGKSDAKKFVQKIKAENSNRESDFTVFSDKNTKNQILSKLDEIARNSESDDLFIFYVAGLGKSGDIILPSNESICADMLFSKSEMIPCQRQLFILDIGEGQEFIHHFKTHLQESNLEKYTTNINRVILTFPMACEINKGGVFTNAICDVQSSELFTLFKNYNDGIQSMKNKLIQYHSWLDGVEIFSEKDFYTNYLKNYHPTRGVIVSELKQVEDKRIIEKGETLGLIIGCQNFENHSRLPNSLNDALALYEVLHNEYRTKNILIINPTYQSLCDTLAFIKEQFQFRNGSQMMIYVASHGVKDAFDNGFIALYDSYKVNEALYNYFPLTSLKRFTTAVDATNTLMLLDICYSASILDGESCTAPTAISIPEDSPIFTTAFGPGSPAFKNFFKQKTHLVFGASSDQEASDGYYVNSPFAGVLISFLSENDNPIIDSHLLQQKITNEVMKLGAISEPIFCSYSAKSNGRFLFVKN